MEKGLKGKLDLEYITQPLAILSLLGSLSRNSAIASSIYFVALLTLGKLSTQCLEIMVPLELRVVVILLYENVVANFKTIDGWSKEIKCNIGVKQGSPLSPTIFCIYINKLEAYLEVVGCARTKLTGIVITLLLYVVDIVLLGIIHEDLDKQINTLDD